VWFGLIVLSPGTVFLCDFDYGRTPLWVIGEHGLDDLIPSPDQCRSMSMSGSMSIDVEYVHVDADVAYAL